MSKSSDNTRYAQNGEVRHKEKFMSQIQAQWNRMIKAMGVEELEIPATLVKFYKQGTIVPAQVMEHYTEELTVTSCQATKQASLGDAICLTRNNIGCIAAAISLGLVDQQEAAPLQGPRVYTELMRAQTPAKTDFQPPTPHDFTEGLVYSCHAAGRPEFGLFGADDSGRYKDVATAKKAIHEMMAIQPPTTQAVFFFDPTFDDLDITPDVIVCSVRPVELTRLIQAYQYQTGQRVESSMGSLRAVNSDLIVRPYLTQQINISPYCLGARLIAQYEANRMGLGIPFPLFEILVTGMEASKTGYPFHLYPGAMEL
ncbi:DUF169 domain-containing protein [Deltaproteobacteria bacterium TL4]